MIFRLEIRMFINNTKREAQCTERAVIKFILKQSKSDHHLSCDTVLNWRLVSNFDLLHISLYFLASNSISISGYNSII